jgi:hypothetical protein
LWLRLLLAKLLQLLLSLFEGVLLDEHGLGEDVERVGIAAERLLEHLFGVGIFFLKAGLIDALYQTLEHLLFLRCHGTPSGTMALSCTIRMTQEDTKRVACRFSPFAVLK